MVLHELLTIDDVVRLAKISRPTLYRWLKAKTGIPQPIHIGPATVRFKRSEIYGWLGLNMEGC